MCSPIALAQRQCTTGETNVVVRQDHGQGNRIKIRLSTKLYSCFSKFLDFDCPCRSTLCSEIGLGSNESVLMRLPWIMGERGCLLVETKKRAGATLRPALWTVRQ